MAVITLTTDFGLSDAYVGVMKGVILKTCREVAIVDITHGIAPQNIRQAAYVIASAAGNFPERTIHVVVVDPGVGSNRRPIAFEAGGMFFVGPDNGVFTKIINAYKPDAVYEITNKDFIEREISGTFHGRDIFAPVAAWLAKGVDIGSVGSKITGPVKLDLPTQFQPAPNLIEGSVIYIDHFGNAITNITNQLFEKVRRDIGAEGMEVEIHAGVMKNILGSYSEAPDRKSLCATIGSWNTLEIFVSSGDAATIHGISVNDRVEVRFY